ncbi:biopolymer transporter ExbD [Sphingomonas sp. LB-2]|uniref:ExbD/TolR family protein n=1 Tax=Sphingomonas caeni TaxID=2984949 RepID=UPI00222E98C7|nr:biopolymer transporter ExbD [Sphingomonas caeni]MCW3849585.1 biopolymer transporter ExbD [Sphingomonas caeni]
MAISTGGGSAETPMSDINTTPLVDVMLVLLIIFLIAIPVVVQSIPLQLPKVTYIPTETKPENIMLQVRGGENGCEVYWSMTKVTGPELYERGRKRLEAVVKNFGANLKPDDIPEVHIRGDINTPYRCIGAAIYTMQTVGFVKVGFISEPPPNSALQ